MVGTGMEPQLPPMQRYSLSEACEILGIHRNTLSRKTREGYIRCEYRREGKRMYPIYLGSEIVRYWRGAI